MRNIFTILAVCASTLAGARDGAEQLTTTAPGVGGIFPHFTPVNPGDRINNKVSLRLTARTALRFNGGMFIPYDSNIYSYSNDRGGVPDKEDPVKDENILFDHSYSYVFDAVYGNYMPSKHRVQLFSPDNKISSLIYSNWRATTGSWKDSARYLYGYNSGKMISSTLELWYANMWTNQQSSTIEYNGDNVTKMVSQFYEVQFSYDANNNLVQMIDKELVFGNMQNKERKSYEYSGKDVTKYTLEKWDAGTGNWLFAKQWEYTYTGADVTTSVEYDWTGSGWQPTIKHMYTYDGAHNKLSDETLVWNGAFQNSKREEWTYNGQNLPEIMTTKTWNGGVWTYTIKDVEYHFYYENYFPSSVNDDMVALDGFSLYPNPATDVLNVALETKQNKPVNCSVVSTSGTIVKQWEQKAGSGSMPISIADLPGGNYFVIVNSETNRLIKQFIVSK